MLIPRIIVICSLPLFLFLDDLQTAVGHMETFHELTSINNWHTESGENLYRISCEHLRRIYTSIAEKVKREGEREKERGSHQTYSILISLSLPL